MEYLTSRSESWDWFDNQRHWWEVTSEIVGYNGVGGYWIIERWRWNGSSEVLTQKIKTLSVKESRELDAVISAHQAPV